MEDDGSCGVGQGQGWDETMCAKGIRLGVKHAMTRTRGQGTSRCIRCFLRFGTRVRNAVMQSPEAHTAQVKSAVFAARRDEAVSAPACPGSWAPSGRGIAAG